MFFGFFRNLSRLRPKSLKHRFERPIRSYKMKRCAWPAKRTTWRRSGLVWTKNFPVWLARLFRRSDCLENNTIPYISWSLPLWGSYINHARRMRFAPTIMRSTKVTLRNIFWSKVFLIREPIQNPKTQGMIKKPESGAVDKLKIPEVMCPKNIRVAPVP